MPFLISKILIIELIGQTIQTCVYPISNKDPRYVVTLPVNIYRLTLVVTLRELRSERSVFIQLQRLQRRGGRCV